MPSPFDIDTPELLIARLRRADAAAQTMVFRQFEKIVYTLCLRMLGGPAAALDALQDSFIQAFAGITNFRADAPFGMWLRTIVVNRCLRELRDQKHSLEASTEILDAETHFNNWPSNALNSSIDLERAMSKLSKRARAVLWLYHVEGYQHAEIAAAFGASISFSKSQLARALGQLREELELPECATQ